MYLPRREVRIAPIFQQTQARCDGLNLAWSDVNVVYKPSPLLPSFLKSYTNEKHILKHQYGKISSGELVGLLGSSGSGKTTLLNTLSFRKVKNLKMTGSIKVNGVEMNRQKMFAASAYVQQEDLFIGTMTVREHLIFHAMLRMHKDLSRQDKFARVDELMHDLLLQKCENSLIGITGKLKGISGGEKKRLSFATEILNNPMILFCDEPTSGLDASMAYTVVECLKKIAKSGKSVLCTIHQPSSETYLMFDSIYVLYDGSLALAGSNTAIINFLSTLNMRLPANYNPADFVLNVLGIKPNSMAQDIARGNYITQTFQQTPLYMAHLRSVHMNAMDSEPLKNYFYDYLKFKNESRASLIVEIFYILKRIILNFFRDRGLLFMRIFQMIMFSVLVGITFLQQDLDQLQYDVMNRAIFMGIMCVSLVSTLSAIVLYPHEFPVVCKEYESKVYHVLSYFFANFLFEIPIYALLTFVFNAIFYWLVGLNVRASAFFISFAWLVVVSQNALGYGQMLSALTSSPLAAIIVVIPALMYQFTMNEFFLASATSPLYWLKYLSWVYFSFNLLMTNQWESIDSIDGTNKNPKSGADVLDMFNIHTSSAWWYTLGLFGLLVLWRLIAFGVSYLRIRFL